MRQAQPAPLAGRLAASAGTSTRSRVDDTPFDGAADTSHPFYGAPYVFTEQTTGTARVRR